MKNILKNKITVLIAALSTLLIGCSDYLSDLPDARTLIDSPEKVSQLITGAYPNSNYMLMAELMSDNVEDKGIQNQTQDLELDMFSWEVSSLDSRDAPTHYWNACYKAISQANQALVSIEELGGNLPEQKGEALLARAYAHFMLVNFWAKHYDPATAASDKGVPYILTPETVLLQKYERNTVLEVYDFIEKDLTEGIALVGNDYESPKFHFTKEAASAFAARFYLYKGDWDKVITYASKVVTNSTDKLRQLEEYSSLSYDENRLRYPSANEAANLLIASTSSLYSRRFGSSRFGLTVTKANELFFGGGQNPYGKAWHYGVYGTDVVYNLPKFKEYFKITNANAGIGQPNLGIVLFTTDELLLNRAEAYAMKKQYAEALADLDAFLSIKTDGYNSATDILTDVIVKAEYPIVVDELMPTYTLDDDQRSYVKMISELKRREFYHEGLRWFDVRRFGMEIKHVLSDGSELILTKEDTRKLLQIPNSAIGFGVEANPR